VYVFLWSRHNSSDSSGIPEPEPEISGIAKPFVILGIDSQNPKFWKPELPDPKFSGNPNAHPYRQVLHACVPYHHCPVGPQVSHLISPPREISGTWDRLQSAFVPLLNRTTSHS
jgi:hypothetical protein